MLEREAMDQVHTVIASLVVIYEIGLDHTA
jgi:hypothetical protein